MDTKLISRLKEKNWTESDIAKTVGIIERHKKTAINLELQYYTILLLTILGNVLASILVIPIIVKFNQEFFLVYLFIAIIALVFGILINYALSELELLDDSYSTLILLFVVFIIIFNSVSLLDLSNVITQNILLSIGKDYALLEPFGIGLIYFFAYMIPWSAFRYLNRKRLVL